MEVMQQLQSEVLALKNRQGRVDNNRANDGAENNQHNDLAESSRTEDGRPRRDLRWMDGWKRNCAKKREDDEKIASTTVGVIIKSEEDEEDIPLLQIDVQQLLMEKVVIG